jgi:hypothetical protein
MVGHAILLEQTSLSHVQRGRQFEADVRRLHWDHYAGLEQQRSEHSEEIQRALLKAAVGPFSFRSWQRIVDFKYTLHPLSARGSLLTDPGGRFNIGDLDQSKFTPFPALYLASDHTTALSEKFCPPGESKGLTAQDFALRPMTSYSSVQVRGEIESVVDLRDPRRLESFVEIIRSFVVPSDLPKRARSLGVQLPRIITSVDELVAALTAVNWRVHPMQMDVPAASQIFGRLAMSAGVEAILYPSTKTDELCMAVFPHKIGGLSRIELHPPVPEQLDHRRLDADSAQNFY